VNALAADLPRDLDRRGIGLLAFGHMSVDACQGVLPPLLPFFVSERGYTYSEASFLILFASLGSSLLQPLLGIYSDRIRAGWLVPTGAALGATGVALVGFMPSYATTAMALTISSIGVAMFHPEAVRFATYISYRSGRRGTGMSFFAVGGMSGWALGPILVTPAVLAFGLEGTALVAILPATAAVVLTFRLGYLERYRPAGRGVGDHVDQGAASAWGAFTLTAAAATLRTGVQFGLQAFIPLYVWQVLGSSKTVANGAVTALLIAGVAGTLIGGRMADRVGFRRVVVGSLAIVVPLVAVLTSLEVAGVYVVMVLLGLTMEANFYPMVVIAQNTVPRHVGFASGVMLGLSIGGGALIAASLGPIADAHGLETAVQVIAVVAALAFIGSYAIPRRFSRAT
jgi:FSR family fosmidomycin resistance protein-like MFS transporter